MANLSNINNKFIVTDSGHALLGTTSTAYSGTLLHIGNTSDSQNGIQIQTSTSGYGYVLFGDGGGGQAYRGQISYNHGSDKLELVTGGSTRVGIAGTLMTFPTLTELRGDIGSNKFAVSNMGNASSQMMVSSRGFLTFNVSNTGSGLDATERMRIDSSGRLSLGPDALDIQIDPASTNSGNNLIYMRGNASNDKSSLQMNHFGYADYYIGVGHVGNGKFNIANDLTGNDFVIDTSGNVGIGVSPYSYSRLTTEGSDNTSSNYAFIAYKENTEAILACRNDGQVTMPSGDVGIGTTSPDGKLEVAGGTTLGLRLSNAGDSSAYDQVRMTYSGYNSGAPTVTFMPLTTPGGGNVDTTFHFMNTNGLNANNNRANVNIDGILYVGSGRQSGETTLIMRNYDTDLVDTNEIQNSIRMSGRYWSGSASQLVETRINSVHQESNGNGGSALTFWTQTGGDAANEKLKIDKNGKVIVYQHSNISGFYLDGGNTRLYANGGGGTDYRGIEVNSSGLWSWGETGSSNYFAKKVGMGTPTPYSRLDIKGVFSVGPANYDPDFTVTSTDVSTIDGGSIELVQGFGGTTSSGDTIVFTYKAQSWKAFQFEYCISAAYGLSKGGGGGYNNNSMSSYYYVTTNQGSNVNVTSVASNNGGSSGQYVVVTITGEFGIHPCVSFKYTQSGGDGAPRADRATLAFNS